MRFAPCLILLFILMISVHAGLQQDKIGKWTGPLVVNVHPPDLGSPTNACPSLGSMVPPNPLPSKDWYNLYLENRSSFSIVWAAVRYKVRGVWRGEGWWRLAAGDEPVWVAVTDQPYYVLYGAYYGQSAIPIYTWQGLCNDETAFNIRGPASAFSACNVCGRRRQITTTITPGRRPVKWTDTFLD